MDIEDVNSLALAHEFIKNHVKNGDLCIDATAGRGRDTAFLCSLAGPDGHVIAFDVQKEAVDSTKARLDAMGYGGMAEVVLDSHENMDKYAGEETVDCIVFNFGWLPGGDHSFFTHADSSIKAIKKGLRLIKNGGIISLCIYYGGRSGYEERDALLRYITEIDYLNYTVLRHDFANRPNCPPIVVDIVRHKQPANDTK